MMRWYKCFARENECKTPTVAHNQHCCKEHWVLILKFIHNQHCCKEHRVLILKFIHNQHCCKEHWVLILKFMHNQHCCKEHWVLILKFIHNQHCCKEHWVLILKFIHNIFNLHDIEVVMCILLVKTHNNIKCERWNILILKTHLFIHFEMTLSCDIGL